ncbi:MAG: signal peptidase I [Lachnospiraceae bacterium]|nr:signal peptidase I [Lachnospiraceae bacterium]
MISEADVWAESLWKDRKETKLNKKLKEVLSTSIYILVVLILTYCVVTFVGQRTEVIGSSMEPTLSDGDNLIVDKITYRMGEPKRFDIVVFPYQYTKGTYYIKRIIGLPGETVQIDEAGRIYINGEVLSEHYGKETITDPGLAGKGVILADDEYFVLGDNRNDSADSRFVSVGSIKREQIVGRAWVRMYPFDKLGILQHE